MKDSRENKNHSTKRNKGMVVEKCYKKDQPWPVNVSRETTINVNISGSTFIQSSLSPLGEFTDGTLLL